MNLRLPSRIPWPFAPPPPMSVAKRADMGEYLDLNLASLLVSALDPSDQFVIDVLHPAELQMMHPR